MQLRPAFALLAFLAVQATASDYVLHERRSSIPPGWNVGQSPTDAEHMIPLRFALKQSNLDRIDEILHDISHPSSPNYGKHWTAAQVASTFAPSQESREAVTSWLLGSGVQRERLRYSPSKSWVILNATVSEAETLLKTKYNIYEHEETGDQHLACTEYHLPSHVAPHIDFITPSIHFDAILKKRGPITSPARSIGQPGIGHKPKTTGPVTHLVNAANPLDSCNIIITPDCIRALYNLTGYEFKSTTSNTFAVAEYTPQAYLAADLDMFARNFSTNLVGKRPKLVSVDGGVVQTSSTGFEYNGESNLDLQYAMSLVNPTGFKQDVILYQVGDVPQGGSFNNLLDALDGSYCNFEGGDDFHEDGIYPDTKYFPTNGYGRQDCGTTKPPNVIATSYGYNEADLSPLYAERQCTEYAKLGMMGVTVVYSSGDNGVAGNNAYCYNTAGRPDLNGTIFNPGFPSTCPYVTSVGATQISPGGKVTDAETACETVIFSGGGFSNKFAMPSYQSKAVGDYLAKHKPDYPAGVWNSTGTSRAFPDISANGANYIIAVDGGFGLVYGTSAAVPTIGAILTMINDARLAVGKKPIGFINPTIYSEEFADAFNDIVTGGNQGCGTSGFSAAVGWDPVTGLGTPSFPKLLSKWLALP